MSKRLLNLNEGEGIRTAVDVVITDPEQKKVLLGLRKAETGTGTWSFIGGHQKTGEQIHETALREITEEVGDDCNVKLTDEVVGVRENKIPPWYVPHITVIIKGIYEGGEIRNNRPDENSEVNWFDFNDLPENLFSGVGEVLQNFRQRKSRVVTDWPEN